MHTLKNIAAPAKRLLRPERVGELYDIAVGYLAKLRCTGEGPEFIKIGSRVYYEEQAIERWLATCRRTSTSDTGSELATEPARLQPTRIQVASEHRDA
jgi:hypothetical protein